MTEAKHADDRNTGLLLEEKSEGSISNSECDSSGQGKTGCPQPPNWKAIAQGAWESESWQEAASEYQIGVGPEFNGGGSHQRSRAELVTQCAADITPEPVEWLWPGRIAIGKQTLVAGEPGLGKSQLSLAMAAAVTTGGLWPCGEGRAPLGNVIILQAEDGVADTVVPRLMAVGADCKRVQLISAVLGPDGRRSFNLQAHLELLEKNIAEVRDVRLAIIDPISSYLGPKVDSHVNAAVRGVLEPVGEMAARRRLAIVSNTHFAKGAGIKAINRFIGSIAFVAAARTAFVVTKHPEDESRCLLLPVKNNLAPLGKGLAFRLEQRLVGDPGQGIVASSVVWDSEPVTISADQALQAVDEQPGGKSAAIEAEEFLRDELAAGPVPANDVKKAAAAHCISSRTLRRAKKALRVIAKRESLGRDGSGQWVWALQDGHESCKGANNANMTTLATLHKDGHLAEDEARASAATACTDDPGPIPECPRRHRCDHCGGEHGSMARQDWPGRPDGVWLHPRCEEAWHDNEGRLQ